MMARSSNLIHRDELRLSGLTWPAGGAADTGLEVKEDLEEELKEAEGGKLFTLLMRRLSV